MKRKLITYIFLIPALIILALSVHAQQSNVRYLGIDVSKYQKQIDWVKVKNAGIKFAMIRTGYGGDVNDWNVQADKYFESNYDGATNAGIKVGVYHYSYATNVSMAEDEADFCLHILNGRHLDYPVAYDIEDPHLYSVSADTMAKIVQTFCSKIQQAGYKTIVYSYVSFYNSKLTNPLISQYDTWIANYIQGSAPHFSGSYTMWQYSSSGYVPGISGACDMDYSYVDYSNSGGSSSSSVSSSSAPTVSLDPLTFLCDTASYEFTTNKQYIYKITTSDTMPPTATSSNPSVVSVSGPTAVQQGYLFTIHNVGWGTATITTTAADGRSTSFNVVGAE